MAAKKQKVKRSSRTGQFVSASKQGGPTRIVGHSKTRGGHEVWHVTAGGRPHKLTTSSSSVNVMDDAVKIYRNALERLAKR